jgi:hypothetical protein
LVTETLLRLRFATFVVGLEVKLLESMVVEGYLV